jgi:hypothetical protein
MNLDEGFLTEEDTQPKKAKQSIEATPQYTIPPYETGGLRANAQEKFRRYAKTILVINLLVGAFLVLTYVTLPEAKECHATMRGPGSTSGEVYGNCTWLYNLMKPPEVADNASTIPWWNTTETTQPCPVRTIMMNNSCPSCPKQSCPTQPTQACPQCQKCQAVPYCPSTDPGIMKQAVDYHPVGIAVGPYLDGAADAKGYYLKLFDIKTRSNFSERKFIPIGGDNYAIEAFNTSIGNLGQGYCFLPSKVNDTKGFWLNMWQNRTIQLNYTYIDVAGFNVTLNTTLLNNATQKWNWSKDSCSSDVMWVQKV